VTSASSGSRPRLVLATLNRAKGRELARLLGDIPWEVVMLAELPGATLPEETGATYQENALLKARHAARLFGARALADDSGLEVDALEGVPGVLTARFGGPDLDDRGRYALLLERLRGVEPARRTARFRCVIALADADGTARLGDGVVEGLIAAAPRGTNGFGYDPVFFYPPLGRTLAQLTLEEKARIDHRGQAARAARRLLGVYS
jgi:XTP/dITP diphosphohydrolase